MGRGAISAHCPRSSGNGTSYLCGPSTLGFAAKAVVLSPTVLLGFRGSKEDFELDPRKNKSRRLIAHGVKMMRGGYRLLLHYPIKLPSRRWR